MVRAFNTRSDRARTMLPVSAFTLLELIVTITVVGILVGIATVTFTSHVRNAQNTATEAALVSLGHATAVSTSANSYAPDGSGLVSGAQKVTIGGASTTLKFNTPSSQYGQYSVAMAQDPSTGSVFAAVAMKSESGDCIAGLLDPSGGLKQVSMTSSSTCAASGAIAAYNAAAASPLVNLSQVAPSAPSGVSLSNPTASSVTVSWVAPSSPGSSPVASYTVTLSNGATCTVQAPTTTCVISGLPEATSVTATVVATSVDGQSPVSAPSSPVTTLASLPPSAPTLAKYGMVDATTYQISWTHPSGPVTGFKIYKVFLSAQGAVEGLSASDSNWSLVSTITDPSATSYDFTTAAVSSAANTGNAWLGFRVVAYNAVGDSAKSNQVTVANGLRTSLGSWIACKIASTPSEVKVAVQIPETYGLTGPFHWTLSAFGSGVVASGDATSAGVYTARVNAPGNVVLNSGSNLSVYTNWNGTTGTLVTLPARTGTGTINYSSGSLSSCSTP